MKTNFLLIQYSVLVQAKALLVMGSSFRDNTRITRITSNTRITSSTSITRITSIISNTRITVQVLPCDGRVLHYGKCENGYVEQVKGVRYRVERFLGSLPKLRDPQNNELVRTNLTCLYTLQP